MVDCVVGGVCEGVVKSRGSPAHMWLHPLVTMLSAHPSLHIPLYLRLRELLLHQVKALGGCW